MEETGLDALLKDLQSIEKLTFLTGHQGQRSRQRDAGTNEAGAFSTVGWLLTLYGRQSDEAYEHLASSGDSHDDFTVEQEGESHLVEPKRVGCSTEASRRLGKC